MHYTVTGALDIRGSMLANGIQDQSDVGLGLDW